MGKFLITAVSVLTVGSLALAQEEVSIAEDQIFEYTISKADNSMESSKNGLSVYTVPAVTKAGRSTSFKFRCIDNKGQAQLKAKVRYPTNRSPRRYWWRTVMAANFDSLEQCDDLLFNRLIYTNDQQSLMTLYRTGRPDTAGIGFEPLSEEN